MKILLGMSGGLDSTYAARKLLDMGHTVEGAVLIMHEYTDVLSARESAESLGIKLNLIDCKEVFKNCVIKNFVSEYNKARTPNPCVICNSEIKFEYLFKYAEEHGFDMMATGHYARMVKRTFGGEERYAVARGKDISKDQTYVLWRLSQKILSKLCFPLSDEEKKDIRKTARELGMASADRSESQEICFIPSGDYASFIEKESYPSLCGEFVDETGNILGKHNGIIRYTVGQRKGLGISAKTRVFVTKIDPETNRITLSSEDKCSDRVAVSGMIFSGMPEPRTGDTVDLAVKLRYLAPPAPCKMTYMGEGRAEILLNTPVRAITPGQSAVFYDSDVLAAGGFIDF